MKKRIFSLLLCIVMCLSLFPMSAFAEGNLSYVELMTISANSGKMINENGVVFTLSRNDAGAYSIPRFDGNAFVPWFDSDMTEEMTVAGNVYTVRCISYDGDNNRSVTYFAFTVENNTVVKLTVSGMESRFADLNGTYVHCHDFTGAYKDNGNGTHSRKCIDCDEYDTASEAHSFTNGVCVCGAKEFVIEDGVLTKYNGVGGDVVIPNEVTAIGDKAFYKNTSITSVTMPNVTSVGTSAFENCSGLRNVRMPNVTAIGGRAFANCQSLQSVDMPSVVSIGEKAFTNCDNKLNNIVMTNATSIGNQAFWACRNITNITVSDKVTVGLNPFGGSNLLTVYYPCSSDVNKIKTALAWSGTCKPLHNFTDDYEDLGNGTHSHKCIDCDEHDTPEAHSYTNGVCVCGAEDLETAKATATAELNAAIATAKCGEAKEVLTQALNDLATAQTVAAVKGIAGNAKNTANQYDNDYSTRLVGYTSALDAELNKPTASESLKARVEKLKEDIANAPTISELDRLFLSNIADIQLEGLKDAAVSEINAAKTDANASIAEAAVTAIGNAQSEDEIKSIKTKALADMKKADELADAKKNAIGTINAYRSDVNASIADAAIADINNATTAAEVSNIVNQTIPKLLAADKKAEFKGKITNELLPAAKCDEAKAILNKALTDLDDAVTLDEVNTVFYNAKGQASGKDSEFAGMLAGYTNAFNSAITDVATDETKAFVSEMLKALDEATSIAQINEIYNSNKDKISVCINRDKSVDDFNKYIDSDKYSDEMKAIAREAIEKLMQAESVSDVEKITKDYKLKLDVQEDKETMREVLASDEYSDEMKALAQNALDELNDVTTSQELTNLWDKYNPLMRLQLTKDDARKEVKELLPENASDAVKKIVSDACDEIQANDDPDQYDDIIKAAAEAIKAQLQKEAELAPAKEAAIAEINDAKTDANASVAEEAVKAINNAQSEDEISALKEQALADMAAADAAAELTAAKEEAKAAIDNAVPADASDAVKAVAENAKAAIDEAKSVEDVNAAKESGIAAIEDQIAADAAAAELADAKETAIDEINKAKTDANTSVAEEAVKAINDATSVDEVSTLKEQALADMAKADAAAELAAAKEEAKEAILAEQGDDTSEAVAKAVEDALAAIEAATTVDEVNAAMEDGIAAIRAAKAGNVPPTPVTYTILNGANSVWTKGSTSGLVVRSDAPFAKFVGVKVDGKTIAATNYTAEEGSTIVTLNSAYLETLETGKHTIEIVSTDGSASTNFAVKANSQPADPTDPQTGDGSMIYLWMLILAISAAGLSAMTVYSRKRKIK